jgi:PKD repeat protein
MTIDASGNVGVATSTPVANFQATTASTNATTTVEFGKANQNKGTCLKLYRDDGSAIYAHVAAGATAFTLTTTPCANVSNF